MIRNQRRKWWERAWLAEHQRENELLVRTEAWRMPILREQEQKTRISLQPVRSTEIWLHDEHEHQHIHCEFKLNEFINTVVVFQFVAAKQFIFEEANLETSILLLLDNHYEDKINGFGDSIHVNPTFNVDSEDKKAISISNEESTFNKNRGYDWYSIYIEGETSSTKYTVPKNKFTNNYVNNGSPSYCGVISSEVATITKESITSANTFSSTEEGIESTPFIHVYSTHTLVPPPEFIYNDTSLTGTDKNRIVHLVGFLCQHP